MALWLFTEKTKSGRHSCIPGRKYGNSFLFRCLCPDVLQEKGAHSACACKATMQRKKFYWSPSFIRLVGVGLLLCMLWATLGYCVYHILPTTARVQREKAQSFFGAAKKFVEEEDYQKAAIAFRKAIQQDNTNGTVHLHFAYCLMKLENFSQAYEEFNEALRQSPGLWEAHLELARLTQQYQLWKISIGHAEKVVEYQPELFEAYSLWVSGLLASAHQKEAERILIKAIAACKLDTMKSILQAAELSVNANVLSQGKLLFEKALALEPDSISARIGLATIFIRQSEWEKAKAAIDQALELEPNNWQALLRRAELYTTREQWKLAMAEYEYLVSLYPKAPYPKTRLAWILCTIMNDKDRAFTILNDILEEFPDHQEALLTSAQLHFDQQRYRRAILKAERVRSGSPEKILHAHRILAQSYGKIKEHRKAIEFCKKVLESEPNNFIIMLQLANANHREGNVEIAIELCKKAAVLNPDSYIPEMYLGNIYRQQKDLVTAISNYEISLRKSPENRMVVNNIATLLVQRGMDSDIDRAFALMKDQIQSDDAPPMMLDTFGWILFHKGAFQRAKGYFQKATEEKKDNPFVYR